MPAGFKGLDLTSPVNRIRAGFAAVCVNVRAYISGGFTLRNRLSNAIFGLSHTIQTIQRLNDTTPSGPVGGYTLISADSAGNLYNQDSVVATGLSGDQVSLVPFQPNQSVQPWMYVGDSSESVPLTGNNPVTITPSASGSSATWTNPTDATSTTAYASYTGGVLNVLTLSLSGLAVPSNATIRGIAIQFTSYVSLSGSLAIGPNFPGAVVATIPLSATASTYALGGPIDSWGAALTPALLNAGFSFDFTADVEINTAFVNGFTISIYYTTPSTFTATGMLKVRSDGLLRKTGIKEPQSAPLVAINTLKTIEYLSLPANTPPWTNIGGVNESYNYSGTDTQPPYPATIPAPVVGSTIALTVTGTATVNGSTNAPGNAGPSTAGYPGDFITSPQIVVFAFTDANGNIIAQATAGGSPPVVGNVGASVTLTVPAGAAQLQIGINSQGGSFAANSGSFLVQAIISTAAITQVSSIVGTMNAYIWGDSPHSGPVASYIWKNPNDTGTGIARSIGSAQATANNNSLILDSTPEDGTVPVLWTTLNSDGTTAGSVDLFSPALESDGYQDFNACITGSLWIPKGGVYAMQLQYKDQIMLGIGGGATSTGGTVYGANAQTMTVVDGLPLLFVSTIDGEGGQKTSTISVTFPEAGIYQFEIDWDYWFHSGRGLIVEMDPTPGAGVATIPPLPQGVRTNVRYWGKYRASETGAQSNPSPASATQLTPVLANAIQLPYSPDPQVDKVDYYRQDDGLPNPTYVATGPNDGLGGIINGIVYSTAVEDTLDDLAAASNQIMAEDDFEPFPSIDTPKSGMVKIVDGVVTWVSGDTFNTRWLPGTLMLIGSPTQLAYSLVARPISTTQIVIPSVPDTIGDAAGNGVTYNIAQPILAQQPLAYLFGPTDNIPFMCAVGDMLRPGTIYWCKGNNLDSAPDTNQQNLTDPSEALVNGAMSGGYAIVFSIRRAWIMVPNFFNSQATATGTSGSTWTFRSTSISRGLFIPRCLAVEGSGKTFFRVDDGIHFSQSGGGSVSITDETLYPLFAHEGSTPAAITRNGVTIYPPDDTKPKLQQMNIQGPYLYYDYMGTDGTYHTLVFDINAMAWVLDQTTPAATTHASNQGLSSQGVLVGCVDGTIRQFSSTGTEAVTGTVMTPAFGGRGWQHGYEITVEYKSSAAVTLSFVAADAGNGSYAPAALTLPSTGGAATKYTTKVGPNKWKWLQMQFSSSDPSLAVYLDGLVLAVKNWGSIDPYRHERPFAEPEGGEGGQA